MGLSKLPCLAEDVSKLPCLAEGRVLATPPNWVRVQADPPSWVRVQGTLPSYRACPGCSWLEGVSRLPRLARGRVQATPPSWGHVPAAPPPSDLFSYEPNQIHHRKVFNKVSMDDHISIVLYLKLGPSLTRRRVFWCLRLQPKTT